MGTVDGTVHVYDWAVVGSPATTCWTTAAFQLEPSIMSIETDVAGVPPGMMSHVMVTVWPVVHVIALHGLVM